MPTSIKVSAKTNKCKPFLLRVMIYSPESGYKFTVEVQKACTNHNEEVWKLLFDLYKKIENEFEKLVSVEFVAGDPNEIEKIAEITEEGMKRPQVRAFRDNVYPLVKPFAETEENPEPEQEEEINKAIKAALRA